MKVVKLKCLESAKFHIGEYTEDQNTVLFNTANIIHSDVLFGAFISALAERNPEKIEDFKSYAATGEWCISSAFYLLERKNEKVKGKDTLFLPKPVSLNLYQAKDLARFDVKKFKKIEFISQKIWEQGITPDLWFDEEGICFQPNSKAICLKEEMTEKVEFYTITDEEKVHLKDGEENELYTRTCIELLGNEAWEVHFYFFMKDDHLPEEDQALALQIWEDVANNGIGGERSTGCGYVKSIEISEHDFSQIPAKSLVALGLIFPETLDHLSYYQTKTRGGMRYGNEDNNKRLKVITAITEGAIIKTSIPARVIDLSEADKKYWKYSSNFVLPLHTNFDFE